MRFRKGINLGPSGSIPVHSLLPLKGIHRKAPIPGPSSPAVFE